MEIDFDIEFRNLLKRYDETVSVHNFKMYAAGAIIGVEPLNPIHGFHSLYGERKEDSLFECFIEAWNHIEDAVESKKWPRLEEIPIDYCTQNVKEVFLRNKLSEISFFYEGLKASRGMECLENNADLLLSFIAISSFEDSIEKMIFQLNKGEATTDVSIIYKFVKYIWPQCFMVLNTTLRSIRENKIVLEDREQVKAKVVKRIENQKYELDFFSC